VETLRNDPLTGLPVLAPAASSALHQGAALAVIDLVHFRDRVNWPHGHLVGDQLLAAAGRRLAHGLAPWRVFRSGGDEFTVEVMGPLDRAAAERLARRVADLLADPFEEIGAGLDAQIGISLRRIEGDAFPVWAEAQRAADVEAAGRGLPFFVIGEVA
jgi:GGDEF domain-containing protein